MADAPVTGLVLSGGGARTSFQIGALRYLYDEVGIAPTVITGTSAGAILAAVLSQSADPAGQRRSLGQLERLLRETMTSSEMFAEQPWFTRLRERGPTWMEALERRRRRQGALGRSFQRVADLRHDISTAAERVARREVDGDLPVEQRVPAPGTAVADAAAATAPSTRLQPDDAGEASRAAVRLLDSIELVRAVGQASADIEAIIEGARRERSMYRPGPLVDRILDPEVFRASAVAASGVTVRVAVVGLESGELRYVTEDGVLVDRSDQPLPDEERVDIVQAVRASCAIPTVFPPVRLGRENYVDGGVRESLPAEIALGPLGVERCYAVVAGPPGVTRAESFDHKDMLSIVVRTTTQIMTDEVQRDEVGRAREAGAVVVEPEFDVHDTLTIEPGLIAIAIDYGYLRAAEAHLGASAEERAVTREAVLLRRRTWTAEQQLFADELMGDEQRLQHVAHIAGMKFELRDLVARIPVERLPEGAQDWWRGWEGHAGPVALEPTWAQG
ncbi:patatin-like phospholipase family protein [Georgenia sp. 311]|uniref:patatin-like phospholipase family protein n=1 Tax=Georgenia sp. 311 TaxID=2585134 RepID=UPI00159BEEBF|nr:patatin-like phospholipase family protein [Georgenia sp. 311]